MALCLTLLVRHCRYVGSDDRARNTTLPNCRHLFGSLSKTSGSCFEKHLSTWALFSAGPLFIYLPLSFDLIILTQYFYFSSNCLGQLSRGLGGKLSRLLMMVTMCTVCHKGLHGICFGKYKCKKAKKQ